MPSEIITVESTCCTHLVIDAIAIAFRSINVSRNGSQEHLGAVRAVLDTRSAVFGAVYSVLVLALAVLSAVREQWLGQALSAYGHAVNRCGAYVETNTIGAD